MFPLPPSQACESINGSVKDTHARDRRWHGRSQHTTNSATVNTATSLACERKHLRLVRDDHEQSVTEAVRQLDQRLEAPPSIYASPVQVGTTEKFRDPFASRPRISWVLRLVGGEEVIVIAPMRLDTTAFNSAVENAMDTALVELEPSDVGL